MAWVIDLDGVIWLADSPIPGSAEAISRLRQLGQRPVFLTNNSSSTVGEYLAKLEAHGIPCGAEDLVTSAQAAATLLEPGDTALVCAGPGVDEALVERGVKTIRTGPADAVVVGWHRDFDFDRLVAATDAVRGGARLIGTNEDATYPTADGGLLPGGGAILAAVATASGATPVVAGKPYQPVADLLARSVDNVDLVVGDRPSTDGRLAQRLGTRFALVLTGVIPSGHGAVDPAADVEAADLAALVDKELGRDR